MKKITLKICFLAVLFLMFSCSKSDTNMNTNEPANSAKHLITQAKAFFYSNINNYPFPVHGTQGERQKIKKDPLWGRAVVMTGSRREVVTIPLNYEKKLQFNHDSRDKKLSLENFSNLLVYKDESGNFKAEVATYFPKENTSEFMNIKFEGYIVVEDWRGNHINTFLIEDGKQYKYINKKSSQKTKNDDGCLAIHWFLCDVVNGVYDNCQYVYTEYTGACYQSLEPCLDGCAGDYTDYELESFKTASFSWNVTSISAEAGGGHVRVTHLLGAKFNNRRPEKNRFIGQSYYAGNNVSLPGNAYASLLSNTTYEHSGTVNTNTQMTLKSRGRYTLPEQWYFEYNNSIIIYLNNCCNWQ